MMSFAHFSLKEAAENCRGEAKTHPIWEVIAESIAPYIFINHWASNGFNLLKKGLKFRFFANG